jgi:hypothetical protein
VAKLYFAKLNINSNINKINNEEINKILNELYQLIDDQKDYKKDIPVKYTDDDGEEQITFREEYYNFSQIEKDMDSKVITGWLVRRMPTYIEEFDAAERKSNPTVYDNTSASTMFYLNLEKEIITFTIKSRLRQLQIKDAFEKLLGNYIPNIGFKVHLITNPFDIDDMLKKMKKVHKLTTILIPPNAANRTAMQKLMKEKSKELKAANLTTETIIWESDKKNNEGINKRSKRFRDLIKVIKAFLEKGYGKTELEGENVKGEEITFDSDTNAPFTEIISDVNKEDRITIKRISEEGILRLDVNRTSKRFKKNS